MLLIGCSLMHTSAYMVASYTSIQVKKDNYILLCMIQHVGVAEGLQLYTEAASQTGMTWKQGSSRAQGFSKRVSVCLLRAMFVNYLVIWSFSASIHLSVSAYHVFSFAIGFPHSGWYVWILQSFLEGEQNTHRSNYGDKVLSRDCPTWGFIPYTVTKTRHYCGCQEVHADRSLI